MEPVQLWRVESWRIYSYPLAGGRDKKGYAEDRRPNANMDPYVVTRLLLETVCSQEKLPAATKGKKRK